MRNQVEVFNLPAISQPPSHLSAALWLCFQKDWGIMLSTFTRSSQFYPQAAPQSNEEGSRQKNPSTISRLAGKQSSVPTQNVVLIFNWQFYYYCCYSYCCYYYHNYWYINMNTLYNGNKLKARTKSWNVKILNKKARQGGESAGREGSDASQRKQVFKKYFKKEPVVPAHAFLPHQAEWKQLRNREKRKTREGGKKSLFPLTHKVRSF